MPEPSVANFFKVLLIGFFSLLAGASLGPEAILVPSCMILGAYLAKKLFKKESQMQKIMAAAGFIALMTAFFHSFVIGLLSVLLITKQAKAKVTKGILVLSVVVSFSSYYALKLVDGEAFAKTPEYTPTFAWSDIYWVPFLLLAGAGLTYFMGLALNQGEKVRLAAIDWVWWSKGLLASFVLSALYLLGGPLVEFTGNTSIQPMLEKAPELGIAGLAWLFVVKMAATAWSKTSGYRGGLVFPSLFAASVVVAIAQLIGSDINFHHGLLAVMVGVIAADTKIKVLF
jgi:H+/Cl- antiporter ClcA